MTLFEIIILALIQGITEFLPVSSSGHLVLGSQLFGWKDQGLAFDVAVHVGSLLAVLVYFREEIIGMTRAWFQSTLQGKHSQEAKLAWYVILGTIPVGLIGIIANDFIEEHLRSVTVVAITMIVFAPFLWLADRYGRRNKTVDSISLRDVMIIGFVQCTALLPGVSRSGATMLAGLGLGMTRQASARFSFLLSIPVILLAGGYRGYKLVAQEAPVDWGAIFLGMGISAISAYICIHYFLKLLDNIGFTPFVYYLLGLGTILLFI
ncbi:MAG: undecaprenyl-diphosphate phosphatase [Pseudomonadota bacterium]